MHIFRLHGAEDIVCGTRGNREEGGSEVDVRAKPADMEPNPRCMDGANLSECNAQVVVVNTEGNANDYLDIFILNEKM